MKKVFSVLLIFVMMFAMNSFVFAEQTSEVMPALHTKGRRIVNENGEQIVLRGVNLGGWLILEEWCTAYTCEKGNLQAFEFLEERFGVEKAYALFNTYYDNYITGKDLDNIAEMGFNCVRVPFWYRNFMYDDKGTWILNENGEVDFSRLDWVVEECGKRGLYVVLDLHGAPGAQGNNDHCGTVGNCRLYEDSAEGEAYRDLTVELWSKIAAHFAGNSTVCMYDLLNEPLCGIDNTTDEMYRTLWSVYDRCYDAVRAVDKDTMITMEGIWRIDKLPSPVVYGWKNVVYQVHLYDDANEKYTDAVLQSVSSLYNVPAMAGEFKPSGEAQWDYTLGLFNAFDVNWFVWTYKGVNQWMFDSNWFLYADKPAYTKADVAVDSYETIASLWGENIRTDEGSFEKTGFHTVLQPYLDGAELEKDAQPGFFEKLKYRFKALVDCIKTLLMEI